MKQHRRIVDIKRFNSRISFPFTCATNIKCISLLDTRKQKTEKIFIFSFSITFHQHFLALWSSTLFISMFIQNANVIQILYTNILKNKVIMLSLWCFNSALICTYTNTHRTYCEQLNSLSMLLEETQTASFVWHLTYLLIVFSWHHRICFSTNLLSSTSRLYSFIFVVICRFWRISSHHKYKQKQIDFSLSCKQFKSFFNKTNSFVSRILYYQQMQWVWYIFIISQ